MARPASAMAPRDMACLARIRRAAVHHRGRRRGGAARPWRRQGAAPGLGRAPGLPAGGAARAGGPHRHLHGGGRRCGRSGPGRLDGAALQRATGFGTVGAIQSNAAPLPADSADSFTLIVAAPTPPAVTEPATALLPGAGLPRLGAASNAAPLAGPSGHASRARGSMAGRRAASRPSRPLSLLCRAPPAKRAARGGALRSGMPGRGSRDLPRRAMRGGWPSRSRAGRWPSAGAARPRRRPHPPAGGGSLRRRRHRRRHRPQRSQNSRR